MAVIVCTVGVVVIAIFGYQDSAYDAHENTPFGYIMVIGSVVCFAVYEVGYGVYSLKSNTSAANSLLFLGTPFPLSKY